MQEAYIIMLLVKPSLVLLEQITSNQLDFHAVVQEGAIRTQHHLYN